MTGRRFPDGLRLPAHKAEAMSRPLRRIKPPGLLIVPLDPGNGRAAPPAVERGARVRVGTVIGGGADDPSGCVVSPAAGTVRDIELREIAGVARRGPCVVIENDGSDALARESTTLPWDALTPAELLSRLGLAGIFGLGGAAYPTTAKLGSASGTSSMHLVLNGAECEPWICCDDVLMQLRADDVVLGARVMMHAASAARCTIAVEDDKPEAIAALETALASAADPRLELRSLPAVYPAGAERQLLAAVTGEEVPHDALPSAIGLLCHNVATAAAVADLARSGRPAIDRIVTVSGSGVARPGNVLARFGTPIAALVEACGGYCLAPRRLIAGGTMTGRALSSDSVPVSQAVNCVVAATAADLCEPVAEMPCIRCGDCAGVCPAGLLPQQLHRAVIADDIAQLERYGLADCIECGCCDYVCPSRIPLAMRFGQARAKARLRLDEQRHALDARERFVRHTRRLEEAAETERRQFEAARARARDND